MERMERIPCSCMEGDAYSGSFDLRLSRLRRDSRGAQDDKSETSSRKGTIFAVVKIKLTHYPVKR